jgi:hypothetical protein
LKAEAKDDFEEADELDGFNGWRMVIRSIRKSAYIHHAEVRREVKSTPPIATLEDIPAAIKRYDAVHKTFKLSGGTPPTDSEKKTDLLESLPKDIRAQLQWRASTPESYDTFRDYVRGTANGMIYHRHGPGAGKARGARGVSAPLCDPSPGQSAATSPPRALHHHCTPMRTHEVLAAEKHQQHALAHWPGPQV